MKIPGVGDGRVVRSSVGNIDVVPTLLDYAGIDSSEYALDGESLRGLVEGAPAPQRVTFSSWQQSRAVVRGETYLTPKVSSFVVDGFLSREESGPLEGLTRRQCEILQLIMAKNACR